MVGKRIRGAIYVHRSALDQLSDDYVQLLSQAQGIAPHANWNVVRFEANVVGLLLYEEFETVAFPALLYSVKIDLETGSAKATDHRRSANPLILHRKELLVSSSHERVARWTATTEHLVELGMFVDSHLIGRRHQWDQRLATAGLRVHEDEVVSL